MSATAAADIMAQARRRRTFAIISHPDAGKSTLTEAMAVHAGVINRAGAVHGKTGRKPVVSDWMALERQRGISITSAVLQFTYRDRVINLLDTPGHSDFAEDTYRVLTAVDAAVLLLDAAKGLQSRALKLYDVCHRRRVPVLTFINKWDCPGREPLRLLDEIEQIIGLRPEPITWPVGEAGQLRGLIDCDTGEFTRFHRIAAGATRAETVPTDRAAREEPRDWPAACDELALLRATGASYDREEFLAGRATPVLFGAALPNIGVGHLLDALVERAPAPRPRLDATGHPRAIDAPVSGIVFKVQSGMDPHHRDRTAFLRICSGHFERGMVLTHAATGRPFATKYAQSLFGQRRATLDEAFPGDIVALANATALRPGDTLYAEQPVRYPPIPSFAPEHFAVAHNTDTHRHKQFRRGIEELEGEGVIQVLRSDRRGDQAPVLAAVGPLQFEILTARLASEFGTHITLEPLPYTLACRTNTASAEVLNHHSEVEVLTRRTDAARLALFINKWRLNTIRREHPNLLLDPPADPTDEHV